MQKPSEMGRHGSLTDTVANHGQEGTSMPPWRL